MKRALSIVILGVLVFAIVPSGSVASENVGTATLDLIGGPSVEAFVPDVQDFDYHVGGSYPYTIVTIVLDCEVDDNNNVDDIVTTFTLWGTLHRGASPWTYGFDDDEWENPSAPNYDNTAIWPMGRTDTNQLSITFGSVPPGQEYWIDCWIIAMIHIDGGDSDAAEDNFIVNILQ